MMPGVTEQILAPSRTERGGLASNQTVDTTFGPGVRHPGVLEVGSDGLSQAIEELGVERVVEHRVGGLIDVGNSE